MTPFKPAYPVIRRGETDGGRTGRFLRECEDREYVEVRWKGEKKPNRVKAASIMLLHDWRKDQAEQQTLATHWTRDWKRRNR